MGLNAGDALRLLAQHPSIGGAIGMGLLGGSGALAYNAISKPTLDEYGNTIESNDINPFVAALGGAAIGAAGGGIYGKMNPASIPIPEEHLGTFRTQTKPVRQVRLQKEIDDLRDEIAITRQGIEEYKKNRKVPDFHNMSDDEFKEFYRNKDAYYIPSWNDKKYINTRMGDIAEREHIGPEITSNLSQPQQSPMTVEPEVMPSQEMPIQGSVAQQTRFVPQLSSEQEALYAEANRLGISPYELERRGWKYNPNQPTIQIVPANPMKPQNPMSPPGADIVVVPQNPAQESADELMALQNLAGSQGNPPNLVNQYFDPSPNVRTFVQDVYSPEEKYLYSQIGQKQFQNPDRLPKLIQQPVRPGQEEFITTRRQLAGNAPGWNVVGADPEASVYSRELAEKQRIQNLQPVYKPRSDDEEMASMQWLRNNRANYQDYQAQKKRL